MRHLRTSLAVIGAATVLVLAGNTIALAATGQALLLGKSNSANTYTSITRTTSGSVLSLKSASSSSAPLAVNSTGKVTNLNADKVDGLDGGTRAITWAYSGAVGGTRTFYLDELPVGTYLISYSAYFSALSSADGLTSKCYLWSTAGGGTFGGEVTTQETATSFPAISGTALLTQLSGGDTALTCSVPVGATWTAPASQPVRITAVPLAGVTNKGTPIITTKVKARSNAK